MSEPFIPRGFNILNLAESFNDPDFVQPMLIPELIPEGEPGLLVGEPGCSKTEISLTLATASVLGVPCLGLNIDVPRTVVYAALEGSARSLGARVRRIAPSLVEDFGEEHLARLHSNLLIMTPTMVRDPDGFDLADLLADNIRRIHEADPHPGLMILDTLSNLVDGDENLASSARKPWGMAQAISNVFGWSTLLLHHLRKASQAPGGGVRRPGGLSDIRGSSAHGASARFVLELKKSGKTSRAWSPSSSLSGDTLELQVIKRNDGPEGFSMKLLRDPSTGGLSRLNASTADGNTNPASISGFHPGTKTAKFIQIYENPNLTPAQKDEAALELFSKSNDPRASLRSALRRYRDSRQAGIPA